MIAPAVTKQQVMDRKTRINELKFLAPTATLFYPKSLGCTSLLNPLPHS